MHIRNPHSSELRFDISLQPREALVVVNRERCVGRAWVRKLDKGGVSIDLRLALRSRLHGAHLSCLSVICIDDERLGRAIYLLFHVTTQACRFFASWILGSLPNFETEDFPLSKSLIRATGRARLKPSGPHTHGPLVQRPQRRTRKPRKRRKGRSRQRFSL